MQRFDTGAFLLNCKIPTHTLTHIRKVFEVISIILIFGHFSNKLVFQNVWLSTQARLVSIKTPKSLTTVHVGKAGAFIGGFRCLQYSEYPSPTSYTEKLS